MSQPDKSSQKKSKASVSQWFGLLMIYLLLCSTTGFLTFMKKDVNPAYQEYAKLMVTEDETQKAFFLDLLKKESNEHLERQNNASQSFHIVLGALLGFMSASATSLLRQKQEE